MCHCIAIVDVTWSYKNTSCSYARNTHTHTQLQNKTSTDCRPTTNNSTGQRARAHHSSSTRCATDPPLPEHILHTFLCVKYTFVCTTLMRARSLRTMRRGFRAYRSLNKHVKQLLAHVRNPTCVCVCCVCVLRVAAHRHAYHIHPS